MTPRAGVKTTLAMERAFSGFPVPSGNPTFFGADRYALARQSTLAHEAKLHSHDFSVLHHP